MVNSCTEDGTFNVYLLDSGAHLDVKITDLLVWENVEAAAASEMCRPAIDLEPLATKCSLQSLNPVGGSSKWPLSCVDALRGMLFGEGM